MTPDMINRLSILDDDGKNELLRLMAELETALRTEAPGIEGYLKRVHAHTLEKPGAVEILDDNAYGILTASLARQRNIQLVEAAGKSARSRKISADIDLSLD